MVICSFLKIILIKKYNKIKGIIVTSSKVNTKKYSWNKFDKKLYSDLSKELIKINKKFNIKMTS